MPPRKLTEPFGFLVDECLGTKLAPAAIAAAAQKNERVFALLDLCARGTPDEEWLKIAGKKGLAVITRDGRLRYRPNERQALLDARVAVIMTPSGTGEEIAKLLADSLPTIRRILRGHEPPLVARLKLTGDAVVLMSAGSDVRKEVKRPIGG